MILPKIFSQEQKFIVSQKHELFELFGFETRNKYSIQNEQGVEIAYAAEQQKGFFGFLFRQMLGHWRSFKIFFFDTNKQVILSAHHPFRFFFQRLEIFDPQNVLIGAIQQRFAIFTKSFDVQDSNQRILLQVRSGLFSIWTFKFTNSQGEVAIVTKKWSGALFELFTDKDKFLIDLHSPHLTHQERVLIVAAGMFIDLQYFENKAD